MVNGHGASGYKDEIKGQTWMMVMVTPHANVPDLHS